MSVRVCAENTEAELLHTYSKVDPLDTLILCVRVAVLVAVALTVPVVLFPVRTRLAFMHTTSRKACAFCSKVHRTVKNSHFSNI